MPVGTSIRKERWHLDYEQDGNPVAFPYIFYDVVLGAALCVLLRGISLLRVSRT